MNGYFYYEGGILKHHGVLGQSWGERHGPPYPLYRSKGAAIRAARRHQKNLNAKAGIASVNATRLIGASDASRAHWKKIANERLKAAQKNEKEFHKEFGEKKRIQKSSSDIGTSKSRYILRNVGHNIGRAAASTALGVAGASTGTRIGSHMGMALNDPYSTGKYFTDTYKNRYKKK